MARTEPIDINSKLMSPLKPHVIVLFGATGDLAQRKLLPGLVRFCPRDHTPVLCEWQRHGP